MQLSTRYQWGNLAYKSTAERVGVGMIQNCAISVFLFPIINDTDYIYIANMFLMVVGEMYVKILCDYRAEADFTHLWYLKRTKLSCCFNARGHSSKSQAMKV